MKRRILIAEDSDRTRNQLHELLSADSRFEVQTTSDGKAALAALESRNFSLFLTDLKMPGLDGMKLIEAIQNQQLPVTTIVMTGFGSIHQAVEAMKLGAFHYLTKPVDFDHLMLIIDRALEQRRMMDELMQLRERIQADHHFHNLVSKSRKMHAVFELINNIADSTATVLIEGETGTGKEQVARAIHQAASKHRKGAMVAINCAALSENLLESELFGHEKGSFTSAVGQRIGRFEKANGGTLFLDEAGDIPPSMQVKLLRVLQERTFERVGGTETIEIDVRVVAATNRDLLKLVKAGKFREDLYYRLNVVRIDLPPLRDRSEDIPILAMHFTTKYSRGGEPKAIAPETMERLLAHNWPGNIRELENAIERCCVTARGPVIQMSDLPPEMINPKPTVAGSKIDLSKSLPVLLQEMTIELEKQYLRRALKRSRGNIGKCATICGLSRRSISAKLTEYDIKKEEFKT